MAKMGIGNLRSLTLVVFWASAVLMAICSSANAQSTGRSYTVSPSTVEQGNEYELIIRSAVCTSNDLNGADLTAPAESGVNVVSAFGVNACTLLAKITIAADAPTGTVSFRVTKEYVVVGLVNVEVTKVTSVVAAPPSSPAARSSPLDAFISPSGKPEPSGPRFETSGQTPLLVNWSKGPIRGESIWGTEFYYDGLRYCALTINNVSVAASLQSGKKTITVILLVYNQANQNIDVVPSRFVLAREFPKPKLFAYIPPEKLAEKVTRDAQRAAFWMALAGAFATRTSTTRSSTTGSLNGFIGSSGSLNGFVGGTFVSGTYIGSSSVSGTYNQSTTSTTTQPDYVIRNLYIQRGMERVAQGEHQADQVLNSAFKANTLIPGRFMSGYVYFTRTDSPDLVLQIPIGNYIFTMPFHQSRP
jgi:hypothetical protein